MENVRSADRKSCVYDSVFNSKSRYLLGVFLCLMPEDIRDKCEDLLNDIMTNQKKKMQEFSDWWKEDPTAQRLYQQSARQAKAYGERLRRNNSQQKKEE